MSKNQIESRIDNVRSFLWNKEEGKEGGEFGGAGSGGKWDQEKPTKYGQTILMITISIKE